MKNRPDLKLLQRFLDRDPENKGRLASYMSHTTTNAIDQWLSRKKLPKLTRRFILKYLNEQERKEA